jgi:hypothetical protein
MAMATFFMGWGNLKAGEIAFTVSLAVASAGWFVMGFICGEEAGRHRYESILLKAQERKIQETEAE